MRKNNTAIIFGGLFFSCSVMAANGTLAPTVVPMVNGGQASIAISNTSPNLFTVPGDRIIAVNSLDGALTNNEQTASGGVVVATVNKKPFTFILETERGLNLSIQAVPREGAGRTIQLVSDLRAASRNQRLQVALPLIRRTYTVIRYGMTQELFKKRYCPFRNIHTVNGILII